MRGSEERSGGVDPDTHIGVLAALNILGGVLVLLGGLFAGWGVWFGTAAATSWMGPWGWFIPEGLQVLASLLLLAAIVIALPAILAGIGLIQRQEWGRVLTFVTAGGVGLFALVSFTLLPAVYSAYAFWALTRPEVAAAFKRDAAVEEVDDEPVHAGEQV